MHNLSQVLTVYVAEGALVPASTTSTFVHAAYGP
jgi:hypothetical protein